MTRYTVECILTCTYEIEAESHEAAEALAAQMLDESLDASAYDSTNWEVTASEMAETEAP